MSERLNHKQFSASAGLDNCDEDDSEEDFDSIESE